MKITADPAPSGNWWDRLVIVAYSDEVRANGQSLADWFLFVTGMRYDDVPILAQRKIGDRHWYSLHPSGWVSGEDERGPFTAKVARGESMLDDVRAFHAKFRPAELAKRVELPTGEALEQRELFVEEESNELTEALFEATTAANDSRTTRGEELDTIAKVAHEAMDVLYVVFGALVQCGIDPWPVWRLVHEANMAKSVNLDDPEGKVIKPDGWRAPDVRGEVARQAEERS